jgi:large subunit ribosomal protein L5
MMAGTAETAPPARLKTRYFEEIRPALIERFGYSSVMQAPRIEKITLNMGVGMAKTDSKVLKAASDQLATIAGQRPSVRRARKSIAAFKLREGNPVGVSVTLRGERGYEFLDRLVTIAIPRIRDFRGLNPRSFDGRGNYSLGVKEQIIFPEVDYDAVDQVRGLDITITTSAASDEEAYALLSAMGMPFSAQGRPRGYDPEADAAAEKAHQEAEAAKALQAEAAAAAEQATRQAEPEPEPEPEAEAETAGEPEAETAGEPEAETAGEPEAETAGEPEAEAATAEGSEEPLPEEAAEEPQSEQASAEPQGEPAASEPAASEPAAEADDGSAPQEAPDSDSAEKESSD